MSTGRHRDQGSLPLAMLMGVVAAGMSAALLTVTVQHVRNTRFDTGRASALMASRTGLESALGAFRAAHDDAGLGRLGDLPCAAGSGSTAPQLTGPAAGPGSRYTVSVYYLVKDPTRRGEAWARYHGVMCATDIGRNPRFAFVSSVGTAPGGYSRKITAIYDFKTGGHGNSPGGHLRIYRTSASVNDLCVDAGALPTLGTQVTMQPCADAADGSAVARQKFAYEPNSTMSYRGGLDPMLFANGLCLETGWPQAVGQPLTLAVCGPATSSRQIWGFNSASSFFGSDDGKTLNTLCWSVEGPDTVGSLVKLNDTSGGLGNPACNTSYPNNYQSWNYDADVGAGSAGSQTRQLVNFEQFGKCLDQATWLTEQKTFPCKQTPDPSVRDWNQVWFLPKAGSSGVIYHDRPPDSGTVSATGPVAPAGPYCLRAPQSVASSPRTTVIACDPNDPNPPDDLIWYVRGADAPTWNEMYRIEGTGSLDDYCIQPMSDDPAGIQGDFIGAIRCSADRRQKWNAVPLASEAGLRNYEEQ
jgi:hypothetical protein